MRHKGDASIALTDLWTSGQKLLKTGLRFTVGEYRLFAGNWYSADHHLLHSIGHL